MRTVPPPLDLEDPLLDRVVVDLEDDLGLEYDELRERVVRVLRVVVLVGCVDVLTERVVVRVPSLFLIDLVFVVVLLVVLVGRVLLYERRELLVELRLALERVLDTVLKALRLAKLEDVYPTFLVLEFL